MSEPLYPGDRVIIATWEASGFQGQGGTVTSVHPDTMPPHAMVLVDGYLGPLRFDVAVLRRCGVAT